MKGTFDFRVLKALTSTFLTKKRIYVETCHDQMLNLSNVLHQQDSQFFRFYPRKTCKSRHFWPTLRIGNFSLYFEQFVSFLCNNLLKYTLTPLIIHTYTLHRKYTLSFYQVTPSSFQCDAISANLYDRIGSDNSKRREITHPLVCWVFQLRGKFVRWDVVLLQLGSDLEIRTLLFVFDLHLQGLIKE